MVNYFMEDNLGAKYEVYTFDFDPGNHSIYSIDKKGNPKCSDINIKDLVMFTGEHVIEGKWEIIITVYKDGLIHCEDGPARFIKSKMDILCNYSTYNKSGMISTSFPKMSFNEDKYLFSYWLNGKEIREAGHGLLSKCEFQTIITFR